MPLLKLIFKMHSGLLLGLVFFTSALASAQLSYDPAGEQHILDLANQSRAEAGLPALKLDAGLTAAARQHSARMAAQQKLTHDFPGEPALPVRLADRINVPITAEGENVGYAPSVEDTQVNFMRSPHHRANLLDANFNVVGFGVVRSGRLVYVTQDFAHATQLQKQAKK